LRHLKSYVFSVVIGLAIVVVAVTSAFAQQTVVYQSSIDRIVAFVAESDGHLYDKYWNGRQWAWEDQGVPFAGSSVSSPSAVYRQQTDQIYVFVTSNDGRLYDKYWDGRQWAWEDQGVPFAGSSVSSPSAVYRQQTDQIYVFVSGSDGRLYDKYWNGSQWVWEDQEFSPTGTGVGLPSAVYQASLDRIIVFVASNDQHLVDKYWNGRQWLWEDQGPFGVISSLSAVYQSNIDRVHVFVVGKGGGSLPTITTRFFDRYWNGRQWIWEDHGVPPGTTGLYTSSAAQAVYQPTLDRVHVFATGVSGREAHIYDNYWNGWQWAWEDQGLPLGAQFVDTGGAVYQPTQDRIAIFGEGYALNGGQLNDVGLYDNYWNGQQWVWDNQGFPGAPDFTISTIQPTQTVAAGSSTSFFFSITPFNGFQGVVTLSVSGLPSGTNVTFNPPVVALPSSSTLTILTSAASPKKTSTLTIVGTSGGLVRSTTVQLTVN
jgi:hypothetical protein